MLQSESKHWKKTYNWTYGDNDYTIISLIDQDDDYKLILTIFNNKDMFIQTTHTSLWKSINHKLDEIITGMFQLHRKEMGKIFYDLETRLGKYRELTEMPLFERFDTSCSLSIKFKDCDEVWLSCDKSMNTNLWAMELTEESELQHAWTYDTGDTYPDQFARLRYLRDCHFEDSTDTNGTAIQPGPHDVQVRDNTEHELYVWAYDKLSKFYVETYSKEVQQYFLAPNPLIDLIFGYLV